MTLRTRIAAVASLSVALAVLAAAVGLYVAVRSDLRGEIDTTLSERAQLFLRPPAAPGTGPPAGSLAGTSGPSGAGSSGASGPGYPAGPGDGASADGSRAGGPPAGGGSTGAPASGDGHGGFGRFPGSIEPAP